VRIEQFLTSHESTPGELVLDIDASDVPLHQHFHCEPADDQSAELPQLTVMRSSPLTVSAKDLDHEMVGKAHFSRCRAHLAASRCSGPAVSLRAYQSCGSACPG